MTNLEAITASIGVPGFNDLAVQKALIDVGLSSGDEYTAGNQLIDKAALKVLKGMLGLQQIQEGDYSIVYAIKDRIKAIEDDLGLPGDRPLVRNKSYMW